MQPDIRSRIHRNVSCTFARFTEQIINKQKYNNLKHNIRIKRERERERERKKEREIN